MIRRRREPPSGASFFGAGDHGESKDAAYKTRAKANDAARAEAAAWAPRER